MAVRRVRSIADDPNRMTRMLGRRRARTACRSAAGRGGAADAIVWLNGSIVRIEDSSIHCFDRGGCGEAGGPTGRQAVRLTTVFASEGSSKNVDFHGSGWSLPLAMTPAWISSSDWNVSSGSGGGSGTVVPVASDELMAPGFSGLNPKSAAVKSGSFEGAKVRLTMRLPGRICKPVPAASDP